MKPGFLMIVVTLLESGDLSAAFVNTKSLQECERRAEAVRTILASQEVPIRDLVCRASVAEFEPFLHGAQHTHAHRYVVTFDARDAWITPSSGEARCDGDPATRGPEKPVQYCAVSTQKLLSEGN